MDVPDSPRLVLALAVLALTIAAVQAGVMAWRKWSRRRRILARVLRAGVGERQALKWLYALGYEVLGAQVAAEYPVCVDGKTVTVGVRADYIVEKNGATYVVEVKTGNVAPRIETPATRRQLLEYRIAFDVDGILLVDAEAERVHAVTFPRLPPALSTSSSKSSSRGAWGLVLFALALVAALALAGLGVDRFSSNTSSTLPGTTARDNADKP